MSRWILSCIVVGVLSSAALSQMCDPALRQVLAPPNGEEWIGLGFSIEIQEDWAYVGAGLDLVDGVDSGSVHIYHFDGTLWVDQGRIVPPDPQSLQYFGENMSIDGNTMMIGAPGDRQFSGAIYVYDRVDDQWIFVQKLTASDGHNSQVFARVFLRGDMAVVGANGWISGPIPGAAYVFERTESGWVEIQKLTPSDSQSGDLFGVSCMFEGEWMIIGSPYTHNFKDFVHGSAYVFHLQDGSWVETQRFHIERDVFSMSEFGSAVAIEGEQIFVGEPGDDNPRNTGSVHVFEQDGDEWVQSQELTPQNDATRRFGSTIELFKGRLIIGAPSFPEFNMGEIELFIDHHGGWEWDGTMVIPVEGETLYGQRLALGEDIAMVLALGFETYHGEVFVYSLGCGTCDGDLNGDAVLDVEDVSAFLVAYNAGSMQADFTMDGTLDFFDVSAFLVEFGVGCP